MKRDLTWGTIYATEDEVKQIRLGHRCNDTVFSGRIQTLRDHNQGGMIGGFPLGKTVLIVTPANNYLAEINC